MPSIVYYGTFCDEDGNKQSAGSNGRSVSVSGAALPSYATITAMRYSIDMSGGGYSSTLNWIVHWLAIGSASGSPYAPYAEYQMQDDDQTLTGEMVFSASDVSKFTSGSFEVYAKVNNNHSLPSYMGNFTITVDYVLYSKCGAPSDVALSKATSGGESVKLSWKAGSAGNDNPVTGYEVQRRYSANGSTWGSWSTFRTITGTSLSVEPPTAFDGRYQYRVRTRGIADAGSAYYSEWISSGTLTKVRPSLTAYTDPTLIAGETKVKAIHMIELQNNINALRIGLGLSAYSFTAIQAGYTSLAGWSGHVQEMRTAIDGISTNHEAWLTLGENSPRAEVITQLRRVVAAV